MKSEIRSHNVLPRSEKGGNDSRDERKARRGRRCALPTHSKTGRNVLRHPYQRHPCVFRLLLSDCQHLPKL